MVDSQEKKPLYQIPSEVKGEHVVFFREDQTFYTIQLCGDKPIEQECDDHAAINPGTIRIERLDGTVVWPPGTTQ